MNQMMQDPMMAQMMMGGMGGGMAPQPGTLAGIDPMQLQMLLQMLQDPAGTARMSAQTADQPPQSMLLRALMGGMGGQVQQPQMPMGGMGAAGY